MKKSVNWIIGGVFLFFFVVLPIVLVLISKAPFPSGVNSDGWAGFLGSYWGGILGGVATLIAVIVTIKNGQKEADRETLKEREAKIKKSTIIVYYDFHFALKNIRDFITKYAKKTKQEEGKIEVRGAQDAGVFIDCKEVLDQFYFDSNWIDTVAVLMDSSEFGPERIKYLYEAYGNLMTINNFLSSDRPVINRELSEKVTICKEACKAMLDLVQNEELRIFVDRMHSQYET